MSPNIKEKLIYKYTDGDKVTTKIAEKGDYAATKLAVYDGISRVYLVRKIIVNLAPQIHPYGIRRTHVLYKDLKGKIIRNTISIALRMGRWEKYTCSILRDINNILCLLLTTFNNKVRKLFQL
jgi:hypothetical protein